MSGAIDRIGGLLSCQPSAPSMALNSGPIRNRVALSWFHQPAHRQVSRLA